MTTEQLSGWFDVAIAGVVGVVTGVVGLIVTAFRLGGRDKAIDQAIAESAEEIRNELHKLRLYVDDQDRLSRHDMYNYIQREVVVKFEVDIQKVDDKVLYHEKHDDKRFELTNNRIWGIELRNAARDGIIPPRPPEG